jgi:hypothetical protein
MYIWEASPRREAVLGAQQPLTYGSSFTCNIVGGSNFTWKNDDISPPSSNFMCGRDDISPPVEQIVSTDQLVLDVCLGLSGISFPNHSNNN